MEEAAKIQQETVQIGKDRSVAWPSSPKEEWAGPELLAEDLVHVADVCESTGLRDLRDGHTGFGEHAAGTRESCGRNRGVGCRAKVLAESEAEQAFRDA